MVLTYILPRSASVILLDFVFIAIRLPPVRCCPYVQCESISLGIILFIGKYVYYNNILLFGHGRAQSRQYNTYGRLVICYANSACRQRRKELHYFLSCKYPYTLYYSVGY